MESSGRKGADGFGDGVLPTTTRVRRVMFGAILSKSDVLNPEIFDLAAKAVKDPDESWWVKDAALQLLGRGSTEQILPLVDLLLSYLKHEEAWLKNAALPP